VIESTEAPWNVNNVSATSIAFALIDAGTLTASGSSITSGASAQPMVLIRIRANGASLIAAIILLEAEESRWHA
jgi:hypothetical protein